MATAYGGYYSGAGYNAFRARMDYSTSATNDTSATIQVIVKCQMGGGHDSGGNFNGTANINGSTSTWTGSGYYSANGTYTMGTKTLSITKTHSAQSITVKATVASTYTWSGHSSTASATVSVPAKTNYKITYNANTGSGAPGAQTKWYGETLTLSTTIPKLDGYDFVGWSTTQSTPGSGTVTHAAGGNYTTNKAVTLYAVWKRAYIAPKISSLSVYRASNDSGAAADDGTYCYLKCEWSVDKTLTSNNQGKTLAIEYKASTASASEWMSAKSVSPGNVLDPTDTKIASYATQTTILKASGAAETFNTSTTYNIRVTVNDTSGQSGNTASATTTLSQAFFTIDFRSGGHGLGVGHSADVEGVFRIGMDVQIDGYADSSNYDRGNFACVDPRLPQNNAANMTSNTWGNGLFFYPPTDFNDTTIGNPIFKSQGYIRGINLSNGWRGVQIEAQRYKGNERYTTPLNLTVDEKGNQRATLGGIGIFMTHGHVGQDTGTPANSYKDFTIKFDHEYSTAPHVIATMYSTSTSATMGSIQIAVTSVSQTGATIRIFNNTSSARSPGFYWLAIGN